MQSDWQEPEHTESGKNTIITVFSQRPEDAVKGGVHDTSLHDAAARSSPMCRCSVTSANALQSQAFASTLEPTAVRK